MIRNEDELASTPGHRHALDAIEAGIAAAQPQVVVDTHLQFDGVQLTVGGDTYSLDSFDNLLVLGGGKAAGHAAAALEAKLGDRIDGGVVVTDTPADTDTIEIIEGTHPLPSETNVDGTRRLLDLAGRAARDDLVLMVVTGGGSALLCAPTDGVSLAEYRAVTSDLLESGAAIDEINAVRKHISQIKGGQLARQLSPATAVGIVFSDVVGNRMDVIASGPTAPDPTTYTDAIDVLDRYDVDVPDAIETLLASGAAGNRQETPGDGDDVFEHVTNYVLADNRTALDAAASVCEEYGYTSVVLSSRIEGEAREVGTVLSGIALECLESGEPFSPPVALLSGGETTVTVRGDGTGGPNQEFAVSAGIEIGADETGVVIASVDTDGVDGPTDAAGGIVDRTTVDDPGRAEAALDTNDAYEYLSERDAIVRTGPTGTNVNDLRVILVH